MTFKQFEIEVWNLISVHFPKIRKSAVVVSVDDNVGFGRAYNVVVGRCRFTGVSPDVVLTDLELFLIRKSKEAEPKDAITVTLTDYQLTTLEAAIDCALSAINADKVGRCSCELHTLKSIWDQVKKANADKIGGSVAEESR